MQNEVKSLKVPKLNLAQSKKANFTRTTNFSSTLPKEAYKQVLIPAIWQNLKAPHYHSLPSTVNSSLFNRYSSTQNYHYIKLINDILLEGREPSSLLFKDWDDYLKSHGTFTEFVPLDDYISKLTHLCEYYKYHNEIPRFFCDSIYELYFDYHDQKRQQNFDKVTNMLKVEKGEDPYKELKKELKKRRLARYQPMLVGLSRYSEEPNERKVEDSSRTLDNLYKELKNMGEFDTSELSMKDFSVDMLKWDNNEDIVNIGSRQTRDTKKWDLLYKKTISKEKSLEKKLNFKKKRGKASARGQPKEFGLKTGVKKQIFGKELRQKITRLQERRREEHKPIYVSSARTHEGKKYMKWSKSGLLSGVMYHTEEASKKRKFVKNEKHEYKLKKRRKSSTNSLKKKKSFGKLFVNHRSKGSQSHRRIEKKVLKKSKTLRSKKSPHRRSGSNPLKKISTFNSKYNRSKELTNTMKHKRAKSEFDLLGFNKLFKKKEKKSHSKRKKNKRTLSDADHNFAKKSAIFTKKSPRVSKKDIIMKHSSPKRANFFGNGHKDRIEIRSMNFLARDVQALRAKLFQGSAAEQEYKKKGKLEQRRRGKHSRQLSLKMGLYELEDRVLTRRKTDLVQKYKKHARHSTALVGAHKGSYQKNLKKYGL